MARGRRSAPARRWPFRLVVVLSTAALVGGSAAIGLMGHGEPEAAPDQQPAATPGAKTGDGAAPSTTSDTAAGTTACLAEVAAGEAVNVALRIATGHWQQHLGAWTAQLTQKSTASSQQIFNRTTQAGPADMKRLADADEAFTGRRGACARLTGQRAQSCRQRLAAIDAASVPGHGASNEWRLHLAAMTAEAAGKQQGVHNRHAWEEAYRTAPRNLNAYAAADAAFRVAPACDPV